MSLLQIHVVLSLLEIPVGLVVIYGLLNGASYPSWTALFLVFAVLTSLTGFPLPPFGFDPPRAVGVLTLVLLGAAAIALYVFALKGAWRMDLYRHRDHGALSRRLRRRHPVVRKDSGAGGAWRQRSRNRRSSWRRLSCWRSSSRSACSPSGGFTRRCRQNREDLKRNVSTWKVSAYRRRHDRGGALRADCRRADVATLTYSLLGNA